MHPCIREIGTTATQHRTDSCDDCCNTFLTARTRVLKFRLDELREWQVRDDRYLVSCVPPHPLLASSSSCYVWLVSAPARLAAVAVAGLLRFVLVEVDVDHVSNLGLG